MRNFELIDIYETSHEKMGLKPYANDKDLINTFVVRYLDSVTSRFYNRNFKPLACLCS